MESTVFEADVPAGDEYVFIRKSTTTGRYQQIVVETPDGFDVCDLSIAGRSQFVEKTVIPAAAFAPGAVQTRLSLDDVQPGTPIEFRVCNVSGERRPFKARLCDFQAP